MHDAEDFHIAGLDTVWQKIGRARHNKFTCAFHTTGTAHFRVAGQQGNRLFDPHHQVAGSHRIVLGNMGANLIKIGQGIAQPADRQISPRLQILNRIPIWAPANFSAI